MAEEPKRKLKEYEELYYKMINIINSCDNPFQLQQLGDNLVKVFRKTPFKKDKIKKKEIDSFYYQLIECVRKKKATVRRRICDEKKKENNAQV